MANVILNIGVVYYGGLWLPITDGMLIPPDSVITIEPNWINNGTSPVQAQVTLMGKYPNAEPFTVAAITNGDYIAQPGETVRVTFADVMLGQREGIWPFEISLTIGGVDAGKQNFAIVVSTTLTENQVRIPLEMQESPFQFTLNPTEIYDHVGAYVYRILPMTIDIALTFHSNGLSYVEALDADNQRWLMEEKTEIDGDHTFNIPWDGIGVFEPRVWKDSHVTGITIEFQIPQDQIVKPIGAQFNPAPYVLGVGLGLGTVIGLRGRKKNVQ
jgi:hypothetical protein